MSLEQAIETLQERQSEVTAALRSVANLSRMASQMSATLYQAVTDQSIADDVVIEQFLREDSLPPSYGPRALPPPASVVPNDLIALADLPVDFLDCDEVMPPTPTPDAGPAIIQSVVVFPPNEAPEAPEDPEDFSWLDDLPSFSPGDLASPEGVFPLMATADADDASSETEATLSTLSIGDDDDIEISHSDHLDRFDLEPNNMSVSSSSSSSDDTLQNSLDGLIPRKGRDH